ncbi:MAG: alkaline phosphatase family protein [Planctomycetota bacterium]
MSSSNYAGRAVWDYLGKAGKQVGILNYPLCIPPYEVNGFMSAGIGASLDGEFTFPPDLKQELNKAADGKYELTADYRKNHYENTELFLNDLERVLTKKLRAGMHLLKEKQWDFFWLILSETDWLQHIMWRHIDESHPLYEGENSGKLYQRFKKLWGLIDEAIGEFCSIVGEKTNLVILSDHGFGPNDELFKLNVWLEHEGYLVWRKRRNKALNRAKEVICTFGKAIAQVVKLQKLSSQLYNWGRATKAKLIERVIDQIDLERSIAFDPGHTMPFGGIYINDRLVDAPQKKELIKEIAQKLRSWGKRNNAKVEIWQRDNLPGDEANTGPDLRVGINDWRCVMPKGHLDGEIFDRRPYSSRHTGSHRMNGVFIAAGPDIQRCVIDKVCIYDIAPTILYLFDQPIPPNIDGQVLKDIITAEYLADHPVKLQTKPQDYKSTNGSGVVKGLTPEDEDNIQQQLKDLGYL